MLFLHEAPSVVAQALASVNRSDLDALIDHYVNKQEQWSASRLCFSLWKNLVGLRDDDRAEYMLQCLSSLSHVDKRAQSGALPIEADTWCAIQYPTFVYLILTPPCVASSL